MKLCDKCRRPPSERCGIRYTKGDHLAVAQGPCDDSIHDLADCCVELEAERDALRARLADAEALIREVYIAGRSLNDRRMKYAEVQIHHATLDEMDAFLGPTSSTQG